MKKSFRTKNMKTKVDIENHYCACCGGGGYFLAVLLLVIGFWFLARDLGWISLGISIWPIILIALGIWLLFKRNRGVC